MFTRAPPCSLNVVTVSWVIGRNVDDGSVKIGKGSALPVELTNNDDVLEGGRALCRNVREAGRPCDATFLKLRSR